jgi:hypothetical protein
VTDLELNTKIVYHSIRHAATAIGANRASVVNYLNYLDLTPYLGRYVIQRVEKLNYTTIEMRYATLRVFFYFIVEIRSRQKNYKN